MNASYARYGARRAVTLRMAVCALLLLTGTAFQQANAQSTTLTLTGVNDPVTSPFLSDLEVDYRRGAFPLEVIYTHPDETPATFSFALTLEHNGRLLLDVTSAPVRLAPGVHRYSALNTPLTPGTPPIRFNRVLDQFPSAFKRLLLRSGALPEGFYTLTLEAIAEDQAVLGMPEVITFEVSNPEPPTLLGPDDASVLTANSFTFAWTPVVGTPFGTTTRYELRIVEVLPFQTPEDALDHNPPHTQVITEDLLYTFVQAREFPLKTGVTYAWRVITHVMTFDNRALVVKDDGKTIVQTFYRLPPIEVIPLTKPGSPSGQAAAFEVRRRAGDLTRSLVVPYAVHRSTSPGKTESVEFAEVIIPAHQNAATIEVAPRTNSVLTATEHVWIALLDPQENLAQHRSIPVSIGPESHTASVIHEPVQQGSMRPERAQLPASFAARMPEHAALPGSRQAGFRYQDEPARRQPFTPLGSIGFVAEGYATSRDQSSRAPTNTQLYANTGFAAGDFRVGFKALYSSESSKASQSLNRYGVEATWRWIKVAGLDVNPTLSKYSLSGRSYHGGLLEVRPGPAVLSATWGRLNRAVETDPDDPFLRPSYERQLYAVHLGLGRPDRTHFHLSSFFARDDTTSIQHSGSLRPAENLTLSPDLGVSFFKGAFKVRLQGAVSAFTRDTRATAADGDNLGLPGALDNLFLAGRLFTPRVGSRLDYAGELTASLHVKTMSHTLTLERVMPGFESLGIGGIATDRQRISIHSQVQTTLFRRSLRFGGQFAQSRNNLLGQRMATQRQQQLSLTTQAALSRHVVVQGGYTHSLTTNLAAHADGPDAARVHLRLRSHNLTFSPTVTVQRNQTVHIWSLHSSYQTLADKSLTALTGERPGSGYRTMNGAFSYSLMLPSSLSLSASASYQKNENQARAASSLGLYLAAGYAFFNQTLSVKLNGGFTHSNVTLTQTEEARDNRVRLWQGSLNAVYKLPNQDTVQLTMRGTSHRPFALDQDAARDLQATLRYEHRF